MEIGTEDLDGAAAVIVPYPDGPLLVRGDFELRTPDGQRIDPGRATIALCRCGRSGLKPFCDGTHKAVGFRAGAGRDGEATTSGPQASTTSRAEVSTAPPTAAN